MSINITGILDGIVSHAAALGYFDRVNAFEPKGGIPGSGLTAAVWVQQIAPVKSSGLGSTTGRLEFMVRIYTSMLAEPQEQIDPNILAAIDALLSAYSGDFTLGDLVRSVDLLGAYGQPLSVQAGYISQSGVMYRVMDVTLPLVINDIWTQGA